MKCFSISFALLALASIAGAIILQVWHPLIAVALSGTAAYVCYFADRKPKPQPTANCKIYYKGDKVMVYGTYGKLCQATVTNPYHSVRVEYTDSAGKWTSRPANPSTLRPCC